MMNIHRAIKLQSLLIDIDELSEDERKIFNYLGSCDYCRDYKYFIFYEIKSIDRIFYEIKSIDRILYGYSKKYNAVYLYIDMLKLANINYKDGNILMLFKKILILYCNFDDTLDVMLC